MWTLERSTNLTSWQTATVMIMSDTDTELVLRDSLPIDAQQQRFLRVRVSEP